MNISKEQQLIKNDILRWKKQLLSDCNTNSTIFVFGYVLLFYPEFRNILFARLKNKGHLLLYIFGRILFKPIQSLIIGSCEIGGGLFIEHGFSTIVSANRIGENCWINQQVTIGNGASGNDRPTIGNNVMIRAGAIIIGDVFIGDNAVIGAGSVVVKDVPPNAVVAGVPAKIIRFREMK